MPKIQFLFPVCISIRAGYFSPFLSNLRRPQLERPIVRGRRNVLRIGRNVHAHHFAVVAAQRLQRLPRLVRPDLRRRIVAGGDQKVAALLLVLDIRHQIRVRRYRVHGLPPPQVPDLARVIVAGGRNVIPVRREIHSVHGPQMALQEHHAAPRPQVPHAAERVQAARARHAAVALERQTVHRLGVALLVQHLLLLLQVPQAPRRIVAGGAEEPAGRMERQTRHPMRHMAADIGDRLLAAERPQLHRAVGRTRCHRDHSVGGAVVVGAAVPVPPDARPHRHAADVGGMAAQRLQRCAVRHRPQFRQARPAAGQQQRGVMVERAVRNRPRVAHLAAVQRQRLDALLQLDHAAGARGARQLEQIARQLQTALGARQRVVRDPEAGGAQRLGPLVVPGALLLLLQLLALLLLLDLLLDGVLAEIGEQVFEATPPLGRALAEQADGFVQLAQILLHLDVVGADVDLARLAAPLELLEQGDFVFGAVWMRDAMSRMRGMKTSLSTYTSWSRSK